MARTRRVVRWDGEKNIMLSTRRMVVVSRYGWHQTDHSRAAYGEMTAAEVDEAWNAHHQIMREVR